ncbi:MAG: polysaccharide export protein [Alkalinema sp. RU_4_3]|nr:polysaccharide export protein [Alkalinema sp. RU_4_3]
MPSLQNFIGLLAGSLLIPTSQVVAQTALPPFSSSESLSRKPYSPQVILPAPSQYSYYLGPGDELKITVAGYPEYTGSQIILSDGTIALPLVGTINASDRTPAQLTQELTVLLNKYVVDPSVSVSIASQRPIIVNVAGEVQRPGPVQLRSIKAGTDLGQSLSVAGVTSQQRPTVTAALLEAGGVTRESDIRKIVLKRYTPSSLAPASPVTINLWDSVTSDAANRDITLQDGDTIFIPKNTGGDALNPQILARSTVAPRTVRVKVVGEVKKPGESLVPPDSNLSSAIAIAGGPTEKARMKEVSFIRMLPNGQLDQKTLDLRLLTDSIQVQDGDVIMVPQTAGDRGLGIANQVASPLGLLLRLFGIR